MRIMRLNEMTGFFVRRLGKTLHSEFLVQLPHAPVVAVQLTGDFLDITVSKDVITSRDSSLSEETKV